MGNRRILSAVLLLLAAFSAASAQSGPLPLPSAPSQRGARDNAIPFYVPPELASQARGTAYTVTTQNDEDDGVCDPADLSLREALTYCGAGDIVVYVPAGDYALPLGEIAPAGSLMIVGENPATTVIHGTVESGIFSFTSSESVTLLNMSFRDAHGENGGAVHVSGASTLTLGNLVFAQNGSTGRGGALWIETNAVPISASLNKVTFTGNTAVYDGGAVLFYAHDGTSNRLTITDSSITGGTAGTLNCELGGGGLAALFVAASGSVVIDSSFFSSNTTACGSGGGAAIRDTDGGSAVSISDSTFSSNNASAGDMSGGGLYVINLGGSLDVSDSTFTSNQADYGGGLYDEVSQQVSIDRSTFRLNTAHRTGGGLLANNSGQLSITNSAITDNTADGSRGAGARGGGILTGSPHVYIADSAITNNAAYDNFGNSHGGGFVHYGGGATLLNSRIEDNIADTTPDCYILGAPMVSLGLNGITSTAGCPYVAHPNDQFNNLLHNGGFEVGGNTASKASGWTPKNLNGDKRTCNTAAKKLTPYGECAFMFTGGGTATSLTQSLIDPALIVSTGDRLWLYATGDGVKGSKVTVQLTVKYIGAPSGIGKFTLTNSTGYQGNISGAVDIGAFPVSSVTVKITDASKSGKFYLDRVYLYIGLPVGPRDVSGMRGGN